MFVSGPRLVCVGKAGQEADGGEVGGGGGGVGLRGEAARRSGAASEVAVWACGVWRRRRGLRRRPPACAFSSWARSGGWQAFGRLGSPACGAGASPLSQRESACARRGCCGRRRRRRGGGRSTGAAGCAKLGAGAEAVRSRIQAVQTSCARRQCCTFAILQASCCRRSSACSRLSARASPRVQRCAGCVRSQHACPPPAPSAVYTWI